MTATLVRHASGEPFYTLSIIEDISERKRAEKDVLKSQAELERRVAERTAALAETNRDLQKESKERQHIEKERGRLLRRIVITQSAERRLRRTGEVVRADHNLRSDC